MSRPDQLRCPICETAFEPEQYGGFCPDCDAPHPGYEHNPSDDESAATTDSVTLVVNGTRYSFEDGDTFGRGAASGGLDDLIDAAGGEDEVAFVSGEHLEFSIDDDGAYVTDVSSNGTTLNGTDLDGGKGKLEDGDTLTLAERANLQVEL